ncbi:MAG: Crp/Fnr family transcriptional regulator [Haliscomenobacter sp.]|nr:Crp/Fnr family transcriptional regulator [Haliscomenobacter sp.]
MATEISSCKLCQVKSCAVAALSDEELGVLSGNIQHVSFKKGETVFKEGLLISHVFYLKKGLIKLHQHVSEEREAILKICFPTCYFGLSTIFGNRTNLYSATAIEPTEVCMIDVSTFKEMIYSNGKFAFEIIADISKDELNVCRRFISLTAKQTNGRIASALLFFARKVYQNPTFELPLSRVELGEFLGISREGVTRGLVLFKQDGLIELDKNRIILLKEDRLELISQSG